MYNSMAAVESLGFEHVSHEMCWEKEQTELLPHVNHQQRYDELLETCQRLNFKLRERKRELMRLQKDNDTLREEIETLKKDAGEVNMAILRSTPLALHEASDSSLRHAGYMLPKFSGTDPTHFAEIWLNMITSCAELYSWSENQSFFAAKMALRGEARHWLLALRRDIDNFEDFKVAFTRQYTSKRTSVSMVHMKLAKRKKLKDEALNDYVCDMKRLARKIHLTDKDTFVYIVLGLSNDEMARARIEHFRTLKELDDYLKELESDEVRVPDLVVSCEKDDASNDRKKICYHCKRMGHVYSECQAYVKSDVLVFFLVIALLAVLGI